MTDDRQPLDYPDDAGLPPPVYPAPSYPAPSYPAPPAYPGYSGYPGYSPYPPSKPPGTNGKAIAALVSALVGVLFCGLPSVAGLILGVIAIRETRRTGQDGYALAMAGAIIGGLVTAAMVLVTLLFIGVFASGYSLV